MVTLNIVPDYDDGTVGKPETVEAMGMKSHIFYLDISVTPAKYTEILSDTERFIHKAVFSPVLTKSGFGNAVTVSPKSVTYAEGAPIPFLEASFELDDETAALLQNKNTPSTVSYVIEDKDGVHGTATAFVTISHEKGSGPYVPSDEIKITLIQPNKTLPGVFTVADPDGVPDSGDETKVQFSQGNLASNTGNGKLGIFPNQYDCMETLVAGNEDIVSLYEYGDTSPWGIIGSGAQSSGWPAIRDWGLIAFPGQGWRMLSAQEWCYLMGVKFDSEWSYEIDESNPRSNLFRIGVEVMDRNCVVLYPDNYQGTKNETFTTESDYMKATESGIVFLPLAGMCSKSSDFLDFNIAGYYWSSTEFGIQDKVYSITFYDYDYILVSYTNNRRYYSVRLVKDYPSGN